MSKPVIDLPLNDYTNTIQKILYNELPKYDYDFLDAFGDMPQEKRIIYMAEFLFNISKALMDKKMIKANVAGLMYKEDEYRIYYGFNRNNRKTDMVTILVKGESEYNGYYNIYSSTDMSFLLSVQINMEDYNVMKTYILNKCIRNKEYMEKIFYRLYGISM